MDQVPRVPKPPVNRWERAGVAAQRIGIPPRLLLSQIEAGLADVRCARLGRRGLVHLAANDVDQLASRLGATL